MTDGVCWNGTPFQHKVEGAVTSDDSANRKNAKDSGSQPAVPHEESGQEPAAQGPSDEHTPGAARWRDAVSIVVELAGIGVLSAGFWLIRPWAGLIVLGAGLIVLGFASSPRFDRRNRP